MIYNDYNSIEVQKDIFLKYEIFNNIILSKINKL